MHNGFKPQEPDSVYILNSHLFLVYGKYRRLSSFKKKKLHCIYCKVGNASDFNTLTFQGTYNFEILVN